MRAARPNTRTGSRPAMTRRHPFLLLVLARMRELMREPEVVFWVFIFPILLAVGLGVAFRNKPPEEILVGVLQNDDAPPIVAALASREGVRGVPVTADDAAQKLPPGKVSLGGVPGEK